MAKPIDTGMASRAAIKVIQRRGVLTCKGTPTTNSAAEQQPHKTNTLLSHLSWARTSTFAVRYRANSDVTARTTAMLVRLPENRTSQSRRPLGRVRGKGLAN